MKKENKLIALTISRMIVLDICLSYLVVFFLCYAIGTGMRFKYVLPLFFFKLLMSIDLPTTNYLDKDDD